MTRLAVHFAVLNIAFAALLTAHIHLLVGLLRRPPRWRAAVAFLIPPLAPWWGWRARMLASTGIWLFSAVAYILALAPALR
jgi:hypothetical protein